MKKLAIVALAAVLAACPLSLLGCGGSSEGNSSSSTESAQSSSSDATETTESTDSEAVDADAVIEEAVAAAEADGKTVTSTEKFDDCDGSGHGVATITFDDGTTQDVEY